MLRENEISGWVNPSHLSSFVIQDKRALLFYFFGKMLNGSSEEVWATLCMPEVSLNRLPCVGSMRTDLQKRPQKSWCEYESKEPLEVHIYPDWMVFSISIKYFCFMEMLQSFLQPHPHCFAICHSIDARDPWLSVVQGDRAVKDSDSGGCGKQVQIIQNTHESRCKNAQ